MTASILPLEAHNLDTTATSISFSSDFVSTMSQRPATKLPLVNPDDEFWVLLKTTPGPGTNTGVGGYQTFYVPEGVEILDTAYVLPDPSDPRTAYNYYGALRPPLVGPPSPMTNNSGDTVGEYFASNVPNAVTREVLGVMTQWDSQQLRAYGRSDVSPLLDSNGGGTAPWGLANVVPGPQSGYAWEFDYDAYQNTSGMNAQKIRAALKISPWNRIKYPGSLRSPSSPPVSPLFRCRARP